ncbi:hypothetical protein DSO57_1006754 [Entomophthora muscae]|uniref:Uncharacterized protein n=1 Tax=Entomophthora muscae TaxID=34485 RepID=A0ACC2RMA2_9FUNG|nr:hypothetical protein DSO57_1006754 [Entomophthora muscae]
MAFTLPKLQYDFTSLEPYIDGETMKIHHDFHHNAYINNLNKALNEKGVSYDLLALQGQATSLGNAIKNNAGGHYNHSLFWTCMAPVGSCNTKPINELKAKIDQRFGSFDQFKGKFNDSAATRFGSGWAWLCTNKDGGLEIMSTPNQENPLMNSGLIPILGLDVWEHAYYLKYQNRRAEYISQWWNVVNWDVVSDYYGKYAKYNIPVPVELSSEGRRSSKL